MSQNKEGLQGTQNKQVSFLESHPKLIMTVFIAVGLYIGYKKFMK